MSVDVRSFVDVDRKFNNMFLTTRAIEVHSSLRTRQSKLNSAYLLSELFNRSSWSSSERNRAGLGAIT